MNLATQLLTKNKGNLRSAFYWGVVAFVLGCMAVTILFEYSFAAFYYLRWILIIAAIVFVLGWAKVLPKLSKKQSFCLLALVVALGVGLSKAQFYYLRSQRGIIAASQIPRYPESQVVEERYRSGDGFTNEPIAIYRFQASGTEDEVMQFFAEQLSQNGWEQKYLNSWKKGRRTISLHSEVEKSDGFEFTVNYAFYNFWIEDVKLAIELKKS